MNNVSISLRRNRALLLTMASGAFIGIVFAWFVAGATTNWAFYYDKDATATQNLLTSRLGKSVAGAPATVVAQARQEQFKQYFLEYAVGLATAGVTVSAGIYFLVNGMFFNFKSS